MSKSQKNRAESMSAEAVYCGYVTKKEAAMVIAAGTRHLHSSPHKERDLGYRITQNILMLERPQRFAWEPSEMARTERLRVSTARNEWIENFSQDAKKTLRRDTLEKATIVIEELLTNAFYHSYKNPDGTEKYPRREVAHLTEAEAIQVEYHVTNAGLYLSVTDKGGHLSFKDIAATLHRCYSGPAPEIENKESGAGLGLYMVFDMVSHLRFEENPSQETKVSCWIPNEKNSDPKIFSFNYFVWR